MCVPPKMLGVVVDLIVQVEEERIAHKLEDGLGYTARQGGNGQKTVLLSFQKKATWTNVHSQGSAGLEISQGYHTNQQFNRSKGQKPKIYLVAELLLGIGKASGLS